MNTERLLIIILFVLIFTVIGWAGPILTAQYVPDGTYIGVEELRTEDATTEDQFHSICITTNVRDGMHVQIERQLLYLSGDSNRFVQQWRGDTFIREGKHTTEYPLALPNDLEPGKYKYSLLLSFSVGSTNVERTAYVESEPFYIYEPENEPEEPFKC